MEAERDILDGMATRAFAHGSRIGGITALNLRDLSWNGRAGLTRQTLRVTTRKLQRNFNLSRLTA